MQARLGGLECYLAAAPASVANGHAVVFVADGREQGSLLALADAWSQRGFLACVPDLDGGASSCWGRPRHGAARAAGSVACVAKALREEHAAAKVAISGFGSGARVALLLAGGTSIVDAVCAAHPRQVKVPQDVEVLDAPALFLCSGQAPLAFTKRQRDLAMRLLWERSPGMGEFLVFPNASDGFALPPAPALAAAAATAGSMAAGAVAADALEQSVRFVQRVFGLEVPPPPPLDATAPPVHVPLQLAPLAC